MANPNSSSLDSELAGAEGNNLFSSIDRDNVHGLNLDVPESAKKVIKPWDEREGTVEWADSGVDDQVIIHVPFTQNVRIRSMLLKLGRGEVAPRRLRIYANHTNVVDFAEAESTKPHLDIALLDATRVTEYPLRVSAFTSVHALSLFFSDADGDERSRIYYIGFRGDIRSPMKDPNTKLDIAAANAADAPLVDKVGEKTAAFQTTAR